MKKLYLNMILALTIAVTGFSMGGIKAKAETQTVDWSVTYTGKGFTSTYDKDKAVIENTMPGDTIAYSVEYNNNTDEAAEFYMSANVVKTLEEGSKATGGAYSYKITTADKAEPIFDSALVGGDAGSDVDSIIGLHQINGNDEAYISLGTVAANSKGNVTVTVLLDGNSQSNSYMSTLATLSIKFGAEPTSIAKEGEKIEEHNTVVKKIIKELPGGTNVVVIDQDAMPTSANPQTGDSIIPLVMCAMALLLGILLILWYFRLTKEENKEVA